MSDVKYAKLSASYLDEFIDLYHSMECLWNVKCKEYRDMNVRNNAYQFIAGIMNITADDVKKKINNIRSIYNQEKKKVLLSKTTGMDAEDVYIPSLSWFHKLKFLDDFILPRRAKSTHESNSVKMPVTCIVAGCKSMSRKDNVSFFSIPAPVNFKHKIHLNNLSRERREMWIKVFKRPDLNDTKLKYQRVCSKHFIEGKPAPLAERNHPDWIPTQNMGYKSVLIKKNINDIKILKRLENRCGNKIDELEGSSMTQSTISNKSIKRQRDEQLHQDIQHEIPKQQKHPNRKRLRTTHEDNASDRHVEKCASEQTEFDKFGESVAAQLKSMPLADALELQLDLQRMITNKRLQLMANDNRFLTSSENVLQNIQFVDCSADNLSDE